MRLQFRAPGPKTPEAMTSSHLSMHFSPDLVGLSVVVATLAAYVSLDLTHRALHTKLFSTRRTWLFAGASSMGLGIWSMHFLGMLALDIRRPVAFRMDLVAVSMVAAVVGAGVALWVITRPGAGRHALFTGAGFMGAAIGTMHFAGMASMEVNAHMTWSLPLVGISVVLAYAASLLALGLVFVQRGESGRWMFSRRVAAALALGLAVAGLHYTAMAAVEFHGMSGMSATHAVNASGITGLLIAAAVVMLVILLAGAQLDQRRAALANDLTRVARVMREIGRSEDARASVCRAACDLTDGTLAGLLEPDGEGNLIVTAAFGMEDAEAIRIPLTEETACGRAFLSSRHRFVSNVPRDPSVQHTLAQRNAVESALYEPVVLDDESVGVLFVGWTARVRRLEDRSISLAGLLAAEAAFVIERADLTAQLERLARTDELTGLANRRTADEELARFLSRARREAAPLAVAMLDLDHFKAYNDTHGHAGGDRLLRTAASRWSDVLRGGDLLARYGGEEFLVLFPGCPTEAAASAADRLREALPEGVTCSVGVAVWSGYESATELVARADAALYEAKESGRDRTVLAPGVAASSVPAGPARP
jgi:diguanylate cyclase (GGDEF)-like protein